MTKSTNFLRVIQAAVIFLGAAFIWYSRIPQDSVRPYSRTVPFKGFQAPELELETIQGEKLNLSSLRGSPVIVNFWATWCPPCRQEMPALNRLYEDYHAAGLVVLAVNSTSQDNLVQVNEFYEEYGLQFPVLLDISGTVSKRYQVQALPTTFFIDAQGTIQDVQVGGPLSEALLRVKAQNLLSEPELP